MLALLLKNSKGRQEALLIFASTAILTILYLLLLQHTDKFPNGVPEIFTFIYGIFITIDAHALLTSLEKRTMIADEKPAGENFYAEGIGRYDFLIKEVRKEIERLEEMTPQSKGEGQEQIVRQIGSFRMKIFDLQEEKFAEIEKLIRQDVKTTGGPLKAH